MSQDDMTTRTKKIKGWAVVSSTGVLWQFIDDTYYAWFNAVGNQRKDAAKFLKVESIGNPDQHVVPCTITYQLPPSKAKKK